MSVGVRWRVGAASAADTGSPPQHRTLPELVLAHVSSAPAASSTASLTPVTGTGSDRSIVVPSPSCPSELSPQQSTVPPPRSAHVCFAPHATWSAPDTAATVTGAGGEGTTVPPPSCPFAFQPQHVTVPPS